MMRGRSILFAGIATLSIAGAGIAAPAGPGAAILTAPLGCHIAEGKVIVITNSTAGTIDAGTKMGYDAVRSPDGHHYGKTFAGPQLAPGASFQIGAQQSTSCTAWYDRPRLMKP